MITLKVVLVGETRVGKSCLLERRLNDVFEEQIPNTIGTAFSSTFLHTANGDVRLQLWDTAGQEQYAALASMYYRNAQVAVLVFDLTRYDTFAGLDRWAQEVKEKAPANIRLILVGNKADMPAGRAVNNAQIQQFRNQIGAVCYIETSAKTGAGVDFLFQSMAQNKPATPEVSPKGQIVIEAATKPPPSGCCYH
jgi:small GTP-binding protein